VFSHLLSAVVLKVAKFKELKNSSLKEILKCLATHWKMAVSPLCQK
jgi:hypothetical protein